MIDHDWVNPWPFGAPRWVGNSPARRPSVTRLARSAVSRSIPP
jgi:hypothetical protein